MRRGRAADRPAPRINPIPPDVTPGAPWPATRAKADHWIKGSDALFEETLAF